MRGYLLLAVVLFGCGTDDGADAGGKHIALKSSPYTLQPGEEKYFCYAMNLPSDVDLAMTKFTPSYGLGTHHILVAQTIATEPDGFSECPVLIRSTWIPMYAGGKDSGPLVMPDGVGLKPLEKGQQILMQLHLQNATDDTITASTSIDIEYVEASPDILPAGIYGLDNRKIEIPPHTDSAMTQMSCKADRDLDVFAVLGHMHKQGIHLDVSRSSGAEMLYQEDWNFETQPVTPLTMHVNKNDDLLFRCTHKNPTDNVIKYGESSDDEMCSLVFYYAPAESLDGCINM